MARNVIGRRAWLGLMAGVGVAAFGCGEDFKRVPVYPATVVLTHSGKPAAGASVALVPAEGAAAPEALIPRGTADAEGKVEFTTYAGSKGVPAGDYVVTVRWLGPKGGADLKDDEGQPSSMLDKNRDYFRNRYNSAKSSPLKLTVAPNPEPTEPKKFELK